MVDKRNKIIAEIYSTEVTYVNCLQQLFDVSE
jgi:hypothetical protein